MDQDAYIVHKVKKGDTLAGLAVRYNIAVSDIKRANGLMSESMMWSRNELMIPKAPLPLSEEQERQLAQLMARVGTIESNRVRLARDAAQSGALRKDAGTTVLDDLNSYYELGEELREAISPRTSSFRSSADPRAGGDVELGILHSATEPCEPDAAPVSLPGDLQDLQGWGPGRQATRRGKASAASAGGSFSMPDDAGPLLGSSSQYNGAVCDPYVASCLPAAAAVAASSPRTAARKVMGDIRSAFADIMEKPPVRPKPPLARRSTPMGGGVLAGLGGAFGGDWGGATAGGSGSGPPSVGAGEARGNSAGSSSSSGPRGVGGGVFSRLANVASQPALGGGGPSRSVIGDSLLGGTFGGRRSSPRPSPRARGSRAAEADNPLAGGVAWGKSEKTD